MRYVGSKARIVKHILPIILKDRKPGQWYIEPFVGGCNIIDKVDGPRIGCDVNPYLIALWRAVQQGWEPPENLTMDEYQHIKEHKEQYPPELVAFVGFGCSFGGKWFGSFASGGYNKGDVPRNHCGESRRNVLRLAPLIKAVSFFHLSFQDLDLASILKKLGPSVIYCDPPYASTLEYKGVGFFPSGLFWDWVRQGTSLGHHMFVSEYNAPGDFSCVWSKKISMSVSLKGEDSRMEKLFVWNPAK